MNAQEYVNIDQVIVKGKSKVAKNEKNDTNNAGLLMHQI